jgi:transcriptional regulator with XRE-family HTH domain
MTAIYDTMFAASEEGDWFHNPGTTSPGTSSRPRKFIVGAIMAGCAATGTLSAVTPADAFALHTVVVNPGTLSPLSTLRPRSPSEEQNNVPRILQRLRLLSGLSWGEIGQITGVSRRTIHNWLNGDRVADVHFARLVEANRVVDLVTTGSAESTRAVLLQPTTNGRSIVDELALAARPMRRRSLASVSAGDLLTPIDETVSTRPAMPQRPSSLRGGSLPRRRLPE